MSKFKNVGEAMAVRDSLITRLDRNRTTLKTARNQTNNPGKEASVASVEAAHEKDCDAFVEAHTYVKANR
jgi:hypothetical protein